MLYLAIDQHKHHLTINVRNEQGDVMQKGQVSTNHADIDEFFSTFAKKSRKHRGYMAIVEICGFNDWLLEKFQKTRCSEIVVIQPGNSAMNKTDKRVQTPLVNCFGIIASGSKVGNAPTVSVGFFLPPLPMPKFDNSPTSGST